MINKLFILTLAIACTTNAYEPSKDYVDNLKDYPSILSMDNFTPRLNSTTNPIQQVIINFDQPTQWEFVDYRDDTTTTYTTTNIVLDNTNKTADMKILGDTREVLFTLDRNTAYYTLFDLSKAPNYLGSVRYTNSAKTFRDVDFSLHQVSVGRYINIEHIVQYANYYNGIMADELFNTGTAGKKQLINGYMRNAYSYFNDISIYYINAQATRYIDQNGTIKVMNQDTYTYPMSITYGALYTGANRMVATANYTRRIIASESTNQEQFIYSGGLSWLDLKDSNIFVYSFNINFRSSLGNLGHTNGLENLLWSPNNLNTLGGSTGTSSSILNNTFTLIKSGFNAVSSFLNFQIFPGISIGLLVFLPFIGGLICLLVRVFKK